MDKNLIYLDTLFAEKVCPNGTEEEKNFAAALMAHSRAGHICMERRAGAKSYPSLICEENNLFYLQKNYNFETTVVQQVRRLLSYPAVSVQLPALNGATEEQKEAVRKALHHPLSLITGGPGTGKSYTALQIIASCQNRRVVVCAPTGKAVRLLEAKCPFPIQSGTLHAILAKKVEADLILVDEASMIDAALFAKLLVAIPPLAHLVLMGDHAQLPAVENGSFFADLVDSAVIPCTALTRCLRSEEPFLLRCAQAVRQGIAPPYEPLSDTFEMENIQLLSAVRKGPFGTEALNSKMAAKSSGAIPIIITRNDPQTGLYNGEMALLRGEEAIFESGKKMARYLLPAYEMAYCLSVHKSQGSEYDHAAVFLPQGSQRFGRQLLYTAVTRAKKSLKIYADKETIEAMVLQDGRKQSGLNRRLRREAGL